MADIRINSLPSTATSFNTDDYIAIDGASAGTRRMLAANPPFSDVTLGTSGPSVKSTLSARAPRQGLVFNGTAGATVSGVAAFGSSDFSVAAWINQTSAANAQIVGASTNGFVLYLRSTGKMLVLKQDTGGTSDSTGSVTAGKTTLVVYTKSGTTGTFYFNGIAGGTVTDNFDYTVAFSTVGKSGSNAEILNGLCIPFAYNRALSASEVVSLYEAGAPAGADYNSASNTAFTNGTFANVGYSTFSGASATGFVATYGGGGEAAATSQIANLAVAPGRKYLIKFDLTLTSGTAPYVGLAQFGVQWLTGSAAVTTGQVRAAAGANSIVVTIRSVNATFATGAGVGFASQEASSFTVSNLTATPLGLLLAPDAAQAGGGLVWYDTSGNAANITLPASGVSWNVPSSLKLGGNWTAAGNLNASGGFYVSGSAVSPNNTACVDLSFQTTYGKVSAINRGVGNFPLALNPEGGSVLVNTTTNSGNGAVQLATHTTSAGGIGFGTDTSLFRTAAGWVEAGGASAALIGLNVGGNNKGYFYSDGTNGTISVNGSLTLKSNGGTTALTLDSSQRCILSGALRLANTYVATPQVSTGYVTIQDSTGTTYKVLVAT